MLECLESLDPGGCPCQWQGGCVCMPVERVLRAYMAKLPMPALSPAHREACLVEIDMVEGYDRKDYEQEEDAGLARGVIHAWTDYCRDKGLL